MPVRNQDLHGNAPDACPVAFLIVDMINDMEFVDADKLFKYALPAARKIAKLKEQAKKAGVPVIYCNDNFGRWRSDFNSQVQHCLGNDMRGKPMVELLEPDEQDYFVLKPKHSIFFATVLDVLLTYLQTKLLVITGIAGDICILFSANDAYLRDYLINVPSDCVASNTEDQNHYALDRMKSLLKADITPSSELDFEELKRRATQ